MLHTKLHKENRALSDQVKDEIIHLIKTEHFPDNRLPAESKLAASMGVSLAVVREALLLLREDGVVTKKHGSGNYFHLSALGAAKRLDQFPGFRTLLEAQGYQVTDTVAKMELVTPNDQICADLKLKKGEEVLFYERTIFADGKPAVHCDNWLPAKLFQKVPENFETPLSLFDIFWLYFGKEMAYGHMRFLPYLTTELEKKQIGVPEGSPIIIMGELYYSIEDIPMAYSYNKFNHDYVQISMLSR
ncbi:MAG: GntR family transcriptional regulator [Bacillota bacterium]